jgi:putative endopeptidase
MYLENCDCCKNPWSDGVGFCGTCIKSSSSPQSSDIKYESVDNSYSPGENFYLFANNNWKKKNPIPNEYSSWNSFMQLRDQNLDRLQSIVNDLESKSHVGKQLSNDETKVYMFYEAFMNEDVAENGVQYIIPIIKFIQENACTDPVLTVSKLHNDYGINVLFSLSSTPDKKNSAHEIGNISQSGLGLPDRDYYFDSDKEEKRNLYIRYIEDLLVLTGSYGILPYNDKEYCIEAAKEIFNIESVIAKTHRTRTLLRNPQLNYNKMSCDDLNLLLNPPNITYSDYLAYGIEKPSTSFDFIRYFELIKKNVDCLGDINVQNIEHFLTINLLCKRYRRLLPNYFIFHLINNISPFLGSNFVDCHFNYHEKILQGTKEIQKRWKRGIKHVESCIGEIFSKLYVAKYFSPDAKTKALDIVVNIKESMKERINEVVWMSEATKLEAKKKLEKISLMIGYPDQWINYSSLECRCDNIIFNLFNARKFDFNLALERMNKPVDRNRWLMHCHVINAYYHPLLNQIVFPAGILEPPFFDAKVDIAVNYGSFGCVVAHEITHGYDDTGRFYNFQGNMIDWWCNEDGAEYEKRKNIMVAQASNYVLFGKNLNGSLTCGENIADLGGITLSLRALKKIKAQCDDKNELINGFTWQQRFFLAWAQCWRENVTEERAKQLLTIDPHSPNEFRTNAPLMNIGNDFLESFNIQVGDAMFIPEENRVDIW